MVRRVFFFQLIVHLHGTVFRDAEYAHEVQTLWDGLMIMVPLETCDPHPFISLMIPAKGKRLLPRLTRHLSHQQVLTLLTLIVACFSQLDVVKNAALLDSQDDTPERIEVDKQTQIFLSSVLQGILPVIAKASLRLLAGMLSLLMNRCDILTVIISRVSTALPDKLSTDYLITAWFVVAYCLPEPSRGD